LRLSMAVVACRPPPGLGRRREHTAFRGVRSTKSTGCTPVHTCVPVAAASSTSTSVQLCFPVDCLSALASPRFPAAQVRLRLIRVVDTPLRARVVPEQPSPTSASVAPCTLRAP